MRTLLAVCLALLLAACGGGGDPAPDTGAPLRVYLMAGQSNILGADAVIDPSKVLDLADTHQQTEADRSSLFTLGGAESYPWGDVRGHDTVCFRQEYENGRRIKGHGPEVGFVRHVGGGVAVVKFAANFSTLEGGRSPWVPGGSVWAAWQSFVDTQLQALGRPYVVAGLVWDQGIDDGVMQRDGEAYATDLRAVLAGVRARFGPLPVVLARSVDSQIAGSTAMAPIRAAQVAVGSEPGNAWITLDDLPLVNTHHLTAAAQLVAGDRYATAMEAK